VIFTLPEYAQQLSICTSVILPKIHQKLNKLLQQIFIEASKITEQQSLLRFYSQEKDVSQYI